MALSTEAADFGWLLDNFVRTVPGSRHAVVVSADGLLMAMSDQLGRSDADRLAAIVSGLASVSRGASGHLKGGSVRQAIVEMDNAFLFLMNVSNGSVLAVVAEAPCDIGLVGYELVLLAARAEQILTPGLITEMCANLRVDDPDRTVSVE